MKYLFVHNNFPAQFRHLAERLAADPENEVRAIGANTSSRRPDPICRQKAPDRGDWVSGPGMGASLQETEFVDGLSGQRDGLVPDVLRRGLPAHSGCIAPWRRRCLLA